MVERLRKSGLLGVRYRGNHEAWEWWSEEEEANTDIRITPLFRRFLRFTWD